MLKHFVDDFFPSETKRDGLKSIVTRIFQGEIIANHEIELKDKRGTSIAVSFNGAPFKDSEGEITSVILAVRDIRD